MSGPVPEWFQHALSAPREERRVDVQGCPIHYLHWGDPSKPGLVLVHGGAAHAHWWAFLAPMLTRGYHVVAIDLSGHGDSGHRPQYPHTIWCEEILAVVRDAGMAQPPMLVGHSMGGLVSIVTAALHGEQLAGAIIVDSPVRRPAPESEERYGIRAFRNPKTYPSKADALAHFRLIPEQPSENRFIVDYVAEHSVRQTPSGEWTWKFDPQVFTSRIPNLHEQLASVRTRVALLRGEFSQVVPEETSDYMYELMGRNAPVVEIPQAHHHLILDQPLAFIAALRTLLADWEHSVPRRRVRVTKI